MAEQNLSYYLGPDLSAGLLNLYRPIEGLLNVVRRNPVGTARVAAENVGPQADIKGMVDSSRSAMQNFGQGNIGAGLLDAAYVPANAATVLLPGSASGMRRAGEKIENLLNVPATTPGRIVNKTNKDGGYSVSMTSGQSPPDGLMMGKYKNTDPRNLVVPPTRAMSRKDVEAFVKKNRKALSDPDNYLGTWKAPDGTVYMDVSRRFEPESVRKATKFGERSEQLAGYNVAADDEFPVGRWPDFVRGPEFLTRMKEMERAGRDYLDQFPAKEWWDTHGSSFERVYGEDNLPQLSGFIASTAPNTAPRPNVQDASEYMRRHIAGEPIVQPDFRMPAGTMSRTEGGLMPMEQSRRANLDKSGRGALEELRLEKVREEASALMGNPSAFVGDRHWVRLSEKPPQGIFAAAEEGVIGSSKNYNIMKEAVADYARTTNRSVRDLSADIWTGIRETIKNTNELFGQKFRGSAIQGDSKSYADHFDELIKNKAKHLGITVLEMEKRLRKGDANLLSGLLAAPVGLMALKIYQDQEAAKVGAAARPAALTGGLLDPSAVY